MPKPRSFRLSLYLATKARLDRRRVTDASDIDQLPSKPDGQLVWFHLSENADLGAVKEVANRILTEREDISFLVTTQNGGSAGFADGLFCLTAPEDTVPGARRFLEHWRPDVAIWVDFDVRPALISAAEERDIPLFMVQSKANTAPAQTLWPRGLVGDVLKLFTAIIARDRRSSADLRQQGAAVSQIETLGPLVEGANSPGCNETERDDLAKQLAGRPTWLAAEIVYQELDAVIAAHVHAQRRSHRLLLIIVPADATNGEAWAARLSEAGHVVAVRSHGDEPEAETQIYIADTEGELGLWFRLAPISFLGQSLVAEGGLNPMAAAALGSAIIHGPNVKSHLDAYDRLTSVGAARSVLSESALERAVEELLSPARAAEMARQAWEVTSSGAEVTDRVVDLILTELETR